MGTTDGRRLPRLSRHDDPLHEAVLATLAIVVWHFYHVIFDPDVYPMNWAWLDGEMSEEQYRHEHPAAPVDERAGEEKSE